MKTAASEATLLATASEALALYDTIQKAFGAPGDHGYSTPEGKALFAIYEYLAALDKAARDVASPALPGAALSADIDIEAAAKLAVEGEPS
ncbi:hypothetical protein FKB34_01985 [Glycocaulis profundi]|nr:hypothetical protein FKB34_01985 [Glycocaulis profundi]